MNIPQVSAFGLTLKLSWQSIASIPAVDALRAKIALQPQQYMFCERDKFYLAIAGVARYLVCPLQNICFIEAATPAVSYSVIATWLMGTVFAYVLQYHGYLVLHGSAVTINQHAVIFSGESGAGKSTLAAALLARGKALLTDDVCVITRNRHGKLVLVPGPPKLKLWEDALLQLNYTTAGLHQVIHKTNKYELLLSDQCTIPAAANQVNSEATTALAKLNSPEIEISHFYELNPTQDSTTLQCIHLSGMAKLQRVVSNTYRYAMLKPLGKINTHFADCGRLAEQISVAQILRPRTTSLNYSLTELVTFIEHETTRVL